MTASGAPPASGSTPSAPPPAGTNAAARSTSVPSARKGYKLTLWVSATTEAGLADVHGLLQLDGTDPIPFCQLKGVPNPLSRALQEAFVAVEQVRAKPPRMTAPPAAPAAPTGARPQAAVPSARPAAPAAPPELPAASPATPPASPTRKPAPVAQPSLF